MKALKEQMSIARLISLLLSKSWPTPSPKYQFPDGMGECGGLRTSPYNDWWNKQIDLKVTE